MLLLPLFFTPALATIALAIPLAAPTQFLELEPNGTESSSLFSVSRRNKLTDWPDRDSRTQIPGEDLYLTIDNYGFHPISPRWALVVSQNLNIIEARLRSNQTQQVLDRDFSGGPVTVRFTKPFHGTSITPPQAAVVIRLLRFWTIAFGGPREVLASTIETSENLLALSSLKIALKSWERGTA